MVGSTPLISICTTVRNRSRVRVDDQELLLFPNFVRSVVSSLPRRVAAEFVITDWDSDDWPLQEWLGRYACPLPVKLVAMEGQFSRGLGRNRAAAAAAGELLLFLDADCLVCRSLIRRALRAQRCGRAFFPIVYCYSSAAHRSGKWAYHGYGNCAVTPELFNAVGGFPEYERWGAEDVEFYESVRRIAEVDRAEVSGFYHQWHPDEFAWKNRYGVASQFEEARRAIPEIAQLVAGGGRVVLIDDAELQLHLPEERRVIPFLERDGAYWGRPQDSAEAIREIERLRSEGASLLAFIATAFWWLDHYREFLSHLRASYELLISNDRLIVFDLTSSRKEACVRHREAGSG